MSSPIRKGRGPLATLLAATVAFFALATPAMAASTALPAPAPVRWGCLPGQQPNPCDGPLDTTYLKSTTLQPRKIDHVETPAPDADRGIDCFYVYPTVTNVPRANAQAALGAQEQAILKYQAARFSQVCNVYAPVYRQATLWGFAPGLALASKGDSPQFQAARRPFDVAYSDVRAAWHAYLARHNNGRGVVLIGHSQGSGLLIRLLREEIDADPAQRNLVVSAIVPGGNLLVPQGQRVGGDLQHLPTCASPGETSCVLAWSTFSTTPPKTALFGRTTGPSASLRSVLGLPNPAGMEVACTNPSELAGDGNQLQAITRSEDFPGPIGAGLKLMFFGLQPRASTTWVVPGERYSGRCARTQGAHVLLIKPTSAASITPYSSPWADWGLHLADINFTLGNLITLVRAQRASWETTHVPAVPAAN